MLDCCGGDGVVNSFWKNDTLKQVDSDWLYCGTCYPDNYGYWKRGNSAGWNPITISEFNILIGQGYEDVSDL